MSRLGSETARAWLGGPALGTTGLWQFRQEPQRVLRSRNHHCAMYQSFYSISHLSRSGNSMKILLLAHLLKTLPRPLQAVSCSGKSRTKRVQSSPPHSGCPKASLTTLPHRPHGQVARAPPP